MPTNTGHVEISLRVLRNTVVELDLLHYINTIGNNSTYSTIPIIKTPDAGTAPDQLPDIAIMNTASQQTPRSASDRFYANIRVNTPGTSLGSGQVATEHTAIRSSGFYQSTRKKCNQDKFSIPTGWYAMPPPTISSLISTQTTRGDSHKLSSANPYTPGASCPTELKSPTSPLIEFSDGNFNFEASNSKFFNANKGVR
ncbi:hypothetical protein FOBRF1_006198 [Fusarium oxysporum]